MDPRLAQQFLDAAARSRAGSPTGAPLSDPYEKFADFVAPDATPAAPAAAPAPAPESGGGTDWKAAAIQAFGQGVLNTPFVGPAIGMAATGLNTLYHGSQQPEAPAAMASAGQPGLIQATPEQEVTQTQTAGPPVISRQVGGGGLPSSYKAAFGETRAGIGEEKAGVAAQGAAIAGGHEAQSDVLGSAAVRLHAAELLAKDRAERQAQVEAEQTDKILEAQRDYESKAANGIQSYWSTKTTGQRVLIALSQAMGAFGAALAKTPNWAMDMIQSEIQQDIQRQKARLELAKDRVEGRKNILATLQQKYQLGEEREAVAESIMWKGVQAQLASLQHGAQGAEAKGKAQELRGQIDQRLGQLNLTIAQKTAAAAARSTQHYIPLEINGQTVYSKTDDKGLQRYALEQQKLGLERQKIGADDGKNIVPGVGRAPDAKTAQEVRAGLAAEKQLHRIVDEVMEIRQDPSWAVSPTKFKRLKQLQAAAVLQSKNIDQLGVLSGSDIQIETDKIGNFTSVLPGTENAIKNFKADVTRNTDANIDTIFGREARQQYRGGASGGDLSQLGTVRGKVK